MIVQVSDLTGVISLGVNVGTGAASVTRTAEVAWLTDMMSVYEREFLCKLLGDDYAVAFMAWQEQAAREENAEYEELLALLEAYTPNPIACYVYFKALDNANMRASATGVHRTADEGSVNARGLQVRAWNIMADTLCLMTQRMSSMETLHGLGFNPLMLRRLNWYGI